MEQVNLSSVDRLDYLKRVCDGKKVLHIGCCGIISKLSKEPENYLHGALCKVAAKVVGVDTDQGELEELRRAGFTDLHFGDANRIDEIDLGEQFDIVLYGNVFDYLANPADVLDRSRRLLAPGGEVIITISNCYAAKSMLRYFAAGRDSAFHHHVFAMGPVTLRALLTGSRYRVVDLHSFWVGPDIFLVQSLKSRLANLFLRMLPRAANLADGLLIRATPDHAGGPGE